MSEYERIMRVLRWLLMFAVALAAAAVLGYRPANAAADIERLDELELRDVTTECMRKVTAFHMRGSIRAGIQNRSGAYAFSDRYWGDRPEAFAKAVHGLRLVLAYARTEEIRSRAIELHLLQCEAGDPDLMGILNILRRGQ